MDDFDLEARQREIQEKNSQQKKAGSSARTLDFWLNSSDLDADIADILHTLQDNKDDFKQLSVSCQVLIKFTNKAVQTNDDQTNQAHAPQWLKAIEQVVQNVQKTENLEFKIHETVPLTNLYISKYRCLKTINNTFYEDSENCLKRAIETSRSSQDKQDYVEASLELAQYYEDISEYEQMKKTLAELEDLCSKDLSLEHNLARIWVFLGEYYFFQFQFNKSRKYLKQAMTKLYLLYKIKRYEWTPRFLSTCLHYIARTYAEEYKFTKAANFYIKAQEIIEQNRENKFLLDDVLSTAFYHLRLGQILDICKIQNSAREHYDNSEKIFKEYRVSKSGETQVKLAKSNMIKHFNISKKNSSSNFSKEVNQIRDAASYTLAIGYYRRYLLAHIQLFWLYVRHLIFHYSVSTKNSGSSFEKEVEQIRDAASDALEIGYYRGYLLAHVQLFWLYVRNLRFHLALQTLWQAFTSDEFNKSGGFLLVYRYVKKIILGCFYKIRFIVWRKLKRDKILYRCPCSSCQNKRDEN
jgi:tetratricopeptide (TPR) repeat protein